MCLRLSITQSFPAILWLFCTLQNVDSSRILFVVMHSSRSHIGSMLPMGMILSEAGHDVHFMQTTQFDEPFKFPGSIKNHFIKVNISHVVHLQEAWQYLYNPTAVGDYFEASELAFDDMMDKHKQEVESLLNTEWDVVFADEDFTMGGYGVTMKNAKVYHKPYIMFSTTHLLQPLAWELALGRSFITRPPPWMPDMDDMHFDVTDYRQRWHVLYAKILAWLSLKLRVEFAKNKGLAMVGIEHFTFADLWGNAAFNFQEEIDYMAFPLPVSNEIVNIGAHCSPSKALSDDIEAFVSDPKSKGTIFIAFGTNVKWAYAPSYVIQAFKEAMLKLKEYRIIFVDDVKEMFVDLAPHIKIMKWAPQYDILRDNRTVLFIGHGGLKSLKETICGKTPTLLIPIFNEQAHNTAVAAKLGFARSLSKMTLTGDKLYSFAHEMLTNRRYKDAVVHIHDVYLDRIIDSLQEALFWTNRSLILSGRKATFQRKGIFMPSSQFFYVPQMFIVFIAVIALSE